MTAPTSAPSSAPMKGTATLWKIDPTHSSAEFSVKHLMITSVKGQFRTLSGTVTIDAAHSSEPKVDILIDAASITTHNEQRDTHLRSPDFFDVARYPTLHFVGAHVEGDVTGEFRLTGDLTIRGVTKRVTLLANAEGEGPDPWGGYRSGFSASAKIRRADWGLTWNQALEAGGVVVGDEVKIMIDVQLVRA